MFSETDENEIYSDKCFVIAKLVSLGASGIVLLKGQSSDSQSVAPGSAASGAPGNLLTLALHQNPQGEGQRSVLASPPGDSDAPEV